MKLRRMVFLTVFLCAVAPVLALSAIVIGFSAKTNKNLTLDNMSAASQLFSNSVDNIFDVNRADIIVTFHVSEVQSFIRKCVFSNGSDPQAIREIARRWELRVETGESIRYIALVDGTGKVLLNNDISKIGTHTRLPNDTFEQIKKAGEYCVTPVFKIPGLTDPCVYAVVLNLSDHNKFHGAMFFVLSPALIQRLVHSAEFFKSYASGSVSILDPDYNIVATSNPVLKVMSNFRDEAKDSDLLARVAAAGISGDVSGTVHYTTGGSKRVGFFHSVPNSGWKIICSVEESELYKPVRRMIFWDCVFVAILLALVTIVFTLLLKHITGPIYDLLSAIHKMRDGDSSARFNNCSTEEFCEVASAYNGLVEQSQDRLRREKERSDFLQNKANHDQLTGLYNKTATQELISECLRDYGKTSGHVLYIMDIDNFKSVNDNLGHGVGDKALAVLARHLSETARESDVVGRIGGDEFMVFLKDIRNIETIANKAEEIRRAFNEAGAAVPELGKMSGSIGGARYPDDGSTFEELYKAADSALYETKSNGKNGWTILGVKRSGKHSDV